MKTYIVRVDWPHSEERMFLIYAGTTETAEVMAEDKLIELGDADPGELSDPNSEIDLIVIEVEGAAVPEHPSLIWVV